MKIYISVDMEGMPGTINWEHEKKDRESVRKCMQHHIINAIEAIISSEKNADFDEICIADSHSQGDNLYYEITDIDERITLISGDPRPQYMMPAFSKEYSVVFLLGYHAGTGAMKGNMDHTYSNSRIQHIWMNNEPMNEALINSAYAGYFGVPIGVVSGDLALYRELMPIMPWIEYVCTKEGIAKFAAKNYSRVKVNQELRLAIHKALNKSYIPLYNIANPTTLRIEFHSTAMAEVACLMPNVKRLDGKTIEYTDADYAVMFDALMALVTLASTTNI